MTLTFQSNSPFGQPAGERPPIGSAGGTFKEALMNWEDIECTPAQSGWWSRAKIPGGWLVKVVEDVIHDQGEYGRGMVGGWDWRVALTFVPDPKHEWVL